MVNSFRVGDFVQINQPSDEFYLEYGTIIDVGTHCGEESIIKVELIKSTLHRFYSDDDLVLADRPDDGDTQPSIQPVPSEPVQEVRLGNYLTLPTDSGERKNYPMLRGCLNYFPAALAGVSHVSLAGNNKHNLGQPLHHARGKSGDHGDCIIRHLTDVEGLIAAFDRNQSDVTSSMILMEVNQFTWRALAYSQQLHERFGAPLAPAAKE